MASLFKSHNNHLPIVMTQLRKTELPHGVPFPILTRSQNRHHRKLKDTLQKVYTVYFNSRDVRILFICSWYTNSLLWAANPCIWLISPVSKYALITKIIILYSIINVPLSPFMQPGKRMQMAFHSALFELTLRMRRPHRPV